MDAKIAVSITDELNKTGLFLERIVFTSLLRHPEFKVRREEPYSGYTSESFEGTIDVLAISKIHDGLLVCILIECKKADPQQKHWVFEQRDTEEEATFPFEYYDAGKTDVNYKKNIFFPSLGYDGMKFFDKAIQSFSFLRFVYLCYPLCFKTKLMKRLIIIINVIIMKIKIPKKEIIKTHPLEKSCAN